METDSSIYRRHLTDPYDSDAPTAYFCLFPGVTEHWIAVRNVVIYLL